MILLDIFTFLGRMHPLIVHLPIGFLLLAIIIHSLSYNKKYTYLNRAVPFTLLIGFGFAALASVLGYFLSLTGDYDHLILNRHKIAGLLLTLMAGVLYATTTAPFRKSITISRPLFSVLSLVTFFLLSYAAHQGATLTHGNNYITLKTLLHRERQKPATAEEAMIFEDIVHPIFEKRCGQCHRQGKRKGLLSMESLAAIMKGGKHGPAVVPGRLAESELYRRITLDPSDEEFMPADGKTPLTKTETEVIRWWIEKGMAAGGKKLSELDDNEAIMPLVASVLGVDGSKRGEVNILAAEKINPDIPSGLSMSLVENLRKKGLVVRVMLHEPVMLDVTLPPRSGKKIEQIESDLKSVAANIVWLNFSDNNFTEHDLKVLAHMTNLEKLRLEKNPISDGIGNHLVSLKHLEAVNLNETKISTACLDKLNENRAIKRIYTWKTMCDKTN